MPKGLGRPYNKTDKFMSDRRKKAGRSPTTPETSPTKKLKLREQYAEKGMARGKKYRKTTGK